MKGQKIISRVIIEIIGAPKEHVDDTLSKVEDQVKQEIDRKVIKSKIFQAEKMKDKPFFSGFIESEIDFKNFDKLMGFCFDFMPSSVEILEPHLFNVPVNDLNNMLNDLIAKLHQYDMVVKNLRAENILMIKEFENKNINISKKEKKKK
jgi:hypothetical protein